MEKKGNTITYTGFEVTLGYLFDKAAGKITTEPLYEQPYWGETQRLKMMAQSEDDNDR